MAFADNTKKIKNKLDDKKSVFSLNYLSNKEKTGVVTGLVLLSVAVEYLFSQSLGAEASTCVSGWNNNTSITSKNTHHAGWNNGGNWCSWSSST